MEYLTERDLICYSWHWLDARDCAFALIDLNNYRYLRR